MGALDASPVIRPRASVLRVHDGDSYLLLLDLLGRGLSEDGCESMWIRLRGYSARELSDTAPMDPKGLGRVTGSEAQSLAQEALVNAEHITVELQGPAGHAAETLGRCVGTVYVDGQNLGELLAAEHAVAAGVYEGVSGE